MLTKITSYNTTRIPRRPRPTACTVAARNLTKGSLEEAQKRLEHARRGQNSRETTAGASKRNGIRAKPQRDRRNATECPRNHSGSVETKAPPHRAGPSFGIRAKPAPPCRRGQKKPEQARRGRNSRETTAGGSKRNGITVGALKRKGIRAKPQRERRNEGPAPPRAGAGVWQHCVSKFGAIGLRPCQSAVNTTRKPSRGLATLRVKISCDRAATLYVL